MQKGIEIRQAHFPGRAPIDAYGNGGFRFAEMSHRGSLLMLPSGVYGWDAGPDSVLSEMLFDKIFEEASDIDVLLVGTGKDIRPIHSPLKNRLRKLSIISDPMNTGAAVRTYNVMLAESRAVAAALIAV